MKPIERGITHGTENVYPGAGAGYGRKSIHAPCVHHADHLHKHIQGRILAEIPGRGYVNANLKMSIFAETKCNFSPVSTEVYTALIHQFTCRFEARQALIYQLVLGLTGENGKYNYSRAVHVYPLFFDITCSAKNYKIAPALTFGRCSGGCLSGWRSSALIWALPADAWWQRTPPM